MNILAPFALLIGMLALVPAVPPSEPNVTRVMESLVRINGENAAGEAFFCTGFVADLAGRVVTARHCVPENGKFMVEGKPSYVIKQDAWISIVGGGEGKKPLQFAKKLPSFLEKVWAFGNAFDWGYIALERSVAGFYDTEAKHIDISVNAPVGPGMSGGPIVNAANEVIAINQMTTNATGIGCEAKAIQALLR